MSEPIIHIPVYEPAGRDIRLSESDLLQHVLVIGATGSGKTSLLHRMIDQSIKLPGTGLLIFDAKEDDTVQRVQCMARAAGREKDVFVLGPNGDRYLDLFEALRSVADVDLVARRMLLAAGSMGPENAFWEESRAAMIDAALTLLVAHNTPVKFKNACRFMGAWFFRPEHGPEVSEVLAGAQAKARKAVGPERQKILQSLDLATMWRTMDNRTRSNIVSTIACVLKPLLGLPASRCFRAYGRPAFDAGEVARHGRICVVSLNATLDPELAGLFFRIVKSDFYRAVNERKCAAHPLCGVIADEWPLIASTDDLEALTTVRVRGCYVLAATQSLSSIDARLGVRTRKAIVTNFGTLAFLRSREDEVDLLAAVHLGTLRRITRSKTTTAQADLVVQEERKMVFQDLVCRPGTLGRLAPHQGFVAVPGQPTAEMPVTFVPWFVEQAPAQTEKIDRSSIEHLEELLIRVGHGKRLGGFEFSRAMALCSKRIDHAGALSAAREFFRSRAVITPDGLELLPGPWLLALPGIFWRTRKPGWTRLPYMLSGVAVCDGLLLLQFAQESHFDFGTRITSWDRLRILVNLSLYPSLLRTLKPRHAMIEECRREQSLDGTDPEAAID